MPPDGAAAELISETGAGVVVSPDDVAGIGAALRELHARFVDGGLPSIALSGDDRERLSRGSRAEDTADLLRAIV